MQQRRHRNKGSNCHHNDGKDACTSVATMQLRATITIATTVEMPAHQWQQCHHGKGNDASFTTSDESNDNNLRMAETPAHKRRQ
jgi:hypothetical protein